MLEKVICPKCQREGLKSTVYDHGTRSTLAMYSGHFDEEGNYVAARDGNTHTTSYQCSNYHRFTIVRQYDDVQIFENEDAIRPINISRN